MEIEHYMCIYVHLRGPETDEGYPEWFALLANTQCVSTVLDTLGRCPSFELTVRLKPTSRSCISCGKGSFCCTAKT